MTLPELCESPVFIIGSPRSGTSILAWALAHHSQFTTGYETDLLYELTDEQKLEAVYRKAAAQPDSSTGCARTALTRMSSWPRSASA